MFKTCLFCNQKFEPKLGANLRTKFCSPLCRQRIYYHKYYKHFEWKKERECVVCHKKFIPNTNNQTQCSVLCRRKKWKKAHWRQVLDYSNTRAKKKAREDWKEKVCLFCKKIFLPDIKHKYAIYCSVNCRVKENYRKSIITGSKKIHRKTYRKNHKDEIAKHDEEYKAKKNFGVTSKTLNKRIVIKRDKSICRLCLKPFQVIHHIKYSGKHRDLVCLCRACHASIHQRIKQEPYWIGEYNFSCL